MILENHIKPLFVILRVATTDFTIWCQILYTKQSTQSQLLSLGFTPRANNDSRDQETTHPMCFVSYSSMLLLFKQPKRPSFIAPQTFHRLLNSLQDQPSMSGSNSSTQLLLHITLSRLKNLFR